MNRLKALVKTHRGLLFPGLLVSVVVHAATFSALYVLLQRHPVHLGGSPVLTVILDNGDRESHARPQRAQAQPITRPASRHAMTPVPITPSPAPDSPAMTDQGAAAEAVETTTSEASFSADYLHNPKPAYPPLSKRLGEQGRVLLEVRVSAAGAALEVNVKQSSGYERLDQAAVDVVKQWEFVPAKRGNDALNSTVEVPVQFILEQ